jgi:hypothetical protein
MADLTRAEVLNLVHTGQADAMADAYARLKAEVERLTRAGDTMADRLIYQGYPETVPAWNAAKEGRSHG